MGRFNKIIKKIIYPPMPLLCVLSVTVGALLAAAFTTELKQAFLSYIIYILSAYVLALWVIRLIKTIKKASNALCVTAFLTDI